MPFVLVMPFRLWDRMEKEGDERGRQERNEGEREREKEREGVKGMKGGRGGKD